MNLLKIEVILSEILFTEIHLRDTGFFAEVHNCKECDCKKIQWLYSYIVIIVVMNSCENF